MGAVVSAGEVVVDIKAAIFQPFPPAGPAGNTLLYGLETISNCRDCVTTAGTGWKRGWKGLASQLLLLLTAVGRKNNTPFHPLTICAYTT